MLSHSQCLFTVPQMCDMLFKSLGTNYLGTKVIKFDVHIICIWFVKTISITWIYNILTLQVCGWPHWHAQKWHTSRQSHLQTYSLKQQKFQKHKNTFKIGVTYIFWWSLNIFATKAKLRTTMRIFQFFGPSELHALPLAVAGRT